MKRALGYLIAICLLTLATGTNSSADIPKPPQTKRIQLNAGMTVEINAKAQEARLQIPQYTFNVLRASLNDPAVNQSFAQSVAHSSKRTVLAGLSLFFALSFGGVWLVRSGSSRGQKALAAVLIGGAIIGAAAIITRANAGPPPTYMWRNLPQNLMDGKATHATVTIEIVPEGDDVKLIVPISPSAKKSDE